jgi:nucleoid DNA-binding protein
LRPKVKRGRSKTLDDIADEIAEQSSFDKGDVRGIGYKFAKELIRHLKYADYIRMGDLGSFYVTCDKDKKLSANYRASKVINGEIRTDFRGEFVNGENAGLDDEGYAQLWLRDNPGDQVVMRDGTTRTAG